MTATEKSCPECGHPMMSGPLQVRNPRDPDGPKITAAWWCANCHHSIPGCAEEMGTVRSRPHVCGKPAKWIVEGTARPGVHVVCGTHVRSYRTGLAYRIKPLGQASPMAEEVGR